jgi:signal transduction histidine kinase
MLEYLYDAFKMIISVTIPLGFTSAALAFSFWGIPVRPNFRRMLAYTVLSSIIMDLMFFVLPYYLRPLNAIFLYLLFIFLLFPGISKKIRLTIGISSFVVSGLVETIVGTFILQFYPLEEMQQNSIILIPFFWPATALVWLLSWLMEKYKLHPGGSILAFIKHKRDRKIPSLMLFFITQILLIVFVFSYRRTDSLDPKFIDTILIIAAACTLVALILVLKVVTQTKNEAIKMTQEMYIDDINRMFTTVRGQRHDFMNHVQVISSLVKMGKKEELEKYTNELVGEITEINEIMSVGNPALAALIQAKSAEAVSRKIDFTYDCSGFKSSSLGFKSIDLIKVVGNLLDNAFDESQCQPPEERKVTLECRTDQSYLIISVNNKGSYISEDIQKKLFQPGFSTKSGENRGLGLSIVLDRIEFYQGTITVDSSHEHGTSFNIRIPEKKAL